MHPHDRPLLDTVRWISAVLVAVGHAIGLIVTPVAVAADHPWAAMFRYIGDLRGPCVILFFVLSGYLVGGGVLLRRAKFKWRSYAIARFSRIYVVLVPAVLLVLVLDQAARVIAPGSPLYAAPWPPGSLGDKSVLSSYTWSNMLATIAAVAGVFGKPIGTGGPLWSLGHEWIFYFLFPALVIPWARYRSWWPTIVAVTLITLGFVAIRHTPTAAFFLIWVMGATSRLAIDHGGLPKWSGRLGLALAVSSFFAIGVFPGRVLDLSLGAGFALFLAHHTAGERGLSRKWDGRFAGISYSLYVSHLTLMSFLAMLLNRRGLLPEPGIAPASMAEAAWTLGLVLLLVVPSLVVGWAFARMFEDRTDLLRRWLDERSSPRRPPSAESPHGV